MLSDLEAQVRRPAHRLVGGKWLPTPGEGGPGGYQRPRRVMSDEGERRFRTRVEDQIERARGDAEAARKRADMEKAAGEERAKVLGKNYGRAKARLDAMNRGTDQKWVKAMLKAARAARRAEKR